MGDDRIRALHDRLDRYPAPRYPIQHAAACHELGAVLLEQGRIDDAARSLAAAEELFAPLPVEQARARNLLGVAHRLAGRLDDAAAAFRAAAAAFAGAGRTVEEGAAWFNLGVVLQEGGESGVDPLRRARALLSDGGVAAVAAQAAAAARELGHALLVAGEVEEAAVVLAGAVAEADAAGDLAGLGAAANGLGLAQLASGDVGAAIESFGTARSAHPRAIRPEGHAMATANLALAHEQRGEHARARMLAGWALAVAEAPEPVVAQASAILDRLGEPTGADLAAVLAAEPVAQHLATVREEVLRWLDAGRQGGEAVTWVEVIDAAPAPRDDLAAAWLEVVLELPRAEAERVAAALVAGLARSERQRRDRVAAALARAMSRFGVPQMQRLQQDFGRLGAGAGLDLAW